jgi:nicotinamidase-related amidase
MKTALLVIDYIYGIINGSCKDYVSRHPIVKKTNQLITNCRQKNIPIYFVRLAFDKHYTGLPKYSNGFNTIKQNNLFQIGNPDAEFVSELDIKTNDKVINKTAASPFHSDLTETLEAENIEKLIFAGVATDNAINIGTREAHDNGYYTIIAEDACGASSDEFHYWSIELLKKIANEIVTVDALIQKL